MNDNSSNAPSETDWKRLARMRDEDIDTSDIPEWTEEEARRATLRVNGKPFKLNEMLVISADVELVSWFTNAGDEIREEARDALRSVMERHR